VHASDVVRDPGDVVQAAECHRRGDRSDRLGPRGGRDVALVSPAAQVPVARYDHPLAEGLERFIHRVARPLRGDLEHLPVGIREVDRREPLPVVRPRYRHAMLQQPSLPLQLALGRRHPEREVVHAT
jgi:hypothetical protein